MSTKVLWVAPLCLMVACTRVENERSPAPPPEKDASAAGACIGDCIAEKVVEHLNAMDRFDAEEQLQASQKALAALGPTVVRAIFDVYNAHTRPGAQVSHGVRAGEMRWRAVYLLGVLGIPDAVPILYDIARQPLPDPRAGEQVYADEYRIRLRAIAGLEQAKAVEPLQRLHEPRGPLTNATTAALFVAGVRMPGARLTPALRALGEDRADPADHHPNKERLERQRGRARPGSSKFKPVPREDTPRAAGKGD